MRSDHNEDPEWEKYLSRFSNEYDERVYDNKSTGYVMRAGHKATEALFKKTHHFSKVLEVAAGTGEHLLSVNHSYDEYILTDGDENALNIANLNCKDLSNYSKIRFKKENASKLSFADNTFDRVVATHILEHLYHPHLAIKEWLRVLKPGGTLSILIPTDPGVAWKVGRHISTRKVALKYGWNYDYIMAREHVNPCNNLIAFLDYYSTDSSSFFWPLKIIPSIDLNLFYIHHSIKP
ncbi:class I SAM-dependent methyltransferase [Vibrio sp. B1Z05]|uniref:class I SAM-dependent methyltransferase n=1 Tax=Vibrio sp. B1Z05 TaxID=2654980 RepID=UPI00128C40E9|nr:class I SAM-dependent methyltransferase [Vibrio sp. B1Z05]MPW34911.1 methyltransferase domain-containing protein [Vibrio sp. B1Z05]